MDTQSGVDTNSVSVTVDGSPPVQIAFTPLPSGYTVVCNLSGLLPTSQTIDVDVTASDLAQTPNQMSVSWSFTTGNTVDTQPPSFTSQDPPPGATGVDRHSEIRVGVADGETGVDLGNVEFYVNGTLVPYTIVGNAASAVLVYANSGGFTAGTTVDVRIIVCDLSSSQNCSTLDTYSFDVDGGFGGLSASEAAILPDGYWTEEPTRPLEVRNIPMGWIVRIFDTSGYQVKYFENVVRDGYDWTWDFRNDNGQQVARALYLVRVTDDGGEVRSRGRFLVQMDP